MQTVDQLKAFHREVLSGQHGRMLQARAAVVTIKFEPVSNRLRRVAGCVDYRSLTACRLTIGNWALNQWTAEQITDLLLHEYAHALTLGQGHNVVWQTVLVELKACCNNDGFARQYYSAEQCNTAGKIDIDVPGKLSNCKTLEDCLALRALAKKNLQGTALTKALNTIGAKALDLA